MLTYLIKVTRSSTKGSFLLVNVSIIINSFLEVCKVLATSYSPGGERDPADVEGCSRDGDDLVRSETHLQTRPEGGQSQRALEREQHSALAAGDHLCKHQSQRRPVGSQRDVQDCAEPVGPSNGGEQHPHLQRLRPQASQENGAHLRLEVGFHQI